MAQYSHGFVSIDQGSKVVSGIDTKFIVNVEAEDLISFRLENSSTTEIYSIESVVSDTSLLLKTSFTSAGIFRAKYAITRNFTTNYGLPQTFLGDEIIANFISFGINKIEEILSGSNNGGYDLDETTAIFFESTSYSPVTDEGPVSVRVLKRPGSNIADQCSFSFTPSDYSQYIELDAIDYSSFDLRAILDTPEGYIISITATLISNPLFKSTCTINVLKSKNVKLTSFTVPANIDVPNSGSVTITPTLVPANATDAVFTIEKPVGFDTYFTAVSVGRTIQLTGKAISSAMGLTIKHLTAGSKITQIKCIDGLTALQSISVLPATMSVNLFQKNMYVGVKFTPDIASINKDVVVSFVANDPSSDFYKFSHTYSAATKTITFSALPNFNDNRNDTVDSVTHSKMIIINPLSEKRTEVALTVYNYVTTGISVSGLDSIDIVTGETIQILFTVSPANASFKSVFVQIAPTYLTDKISIHGNSIPEINGIYTFMEGESLSIKGEKEGNTKLRITTVRTGIYTDVLINVALGARVITSDLIITDLTPANNIVNGVGSFKIQFVPPDASDKRVTITSSNQSIMRLPVSLYTATGINDYVIVSPTYYQAGDVYLIIQVMDGSHYEERKLITVIGNENVCPVPVNSISFDLLNSEPPITTNSNGVALIPANSIQKIKMIVSPPNATCKQMTYGLEFAYGPANQGGSGEYIVPHIRTYTTGQAPATASTDEYLNLLTFYATSGEFTVNAEVSNGATMCELVCMSIDPIPVTSISFDLSKSQITLVDGVAEIQSNFTKDLFVTVYPTNASDKNVLFSISPGSCSILDSNDDHVTIKTGNSSSSVFTVYVKGEHNNCTAQLSIRVINSKLITSASFNLAASGISLNGEGRALIKANSNTKIYTTFLPINATNCDFIYSMTMVNIPPGRSGQFIAGESTSPDLNSNDSYASLLPYAYYGGQQFSLTLKSTANPLVESTIQCELYDAIPVTAININLATSGLAVGGDGCVALARNTYTRVFVWVSPTDASNKNIVYSITGAGLAFIDVTGHERDTGNTTNVYRSTNDYCYIRTFDDTYEGEFTLTVTGLTNGKSASQRFKLGATGVPIISLEFDLSSATLNPDGSVNAQGAFNAQLWVKKNPLTTTEKQIVYSIDKGSISQYTILYVSAHQRTSNNMYASTDEYAYVVMACIDPSDYNKTFTVKAASLTNPSVFVTVTGITRAPDWVMP